MYGTNVLYKPALSSGVLAAYLGGIIGAFVFSIIAGIIIYRIVKLKINERKLK